MDKLEVVKDEFRSIISSSKQIALNDGKITQEEAVLLDLLEGNLKDIESEIVPILDSLDPNISEVELRQRVKLVAQQILPKLTEFAKNDNVITQDEAAILSKVLSSIK